MLNDPVAALAARPGGALALLVASEGGFPRRPGAMMAVWPDGTACGRLGAGCIDADLALHAEGEAPVARLIYGQGGPVDLPLPCGGSIRIALIRRPDPAWLAAIIADRQARRTGQWRVDLTTGQAVAEGQGDGFALTLHPPVALHLHGNGDEAQALAAMAQGLGLPCHLDRPELLPDAHSAVITLHHDHDRELPPLRAALASPAFFIGALGSRRAQTARIMALSQAGMSVADCARIHGPIGVVAPVREPALLAASVLTQVLAEYDRAFG